MAAIRHPDYATWLCDATYQWPRNSRRLTRHSRCEMVTWLFQSRDFSSRWSRELTASRTKRDGTWIYSWKRPLWQLVLQFTCTRHHVTTWHEYFHVTRYVTRQARRNSSTSTQGFQLVARWCSFKLKQMWKCLKDSSINTFWDCLRY